MFNNISPSIERLPVEIFHRIFDNLDVETILCSIRPVCRLLRSIVNTYDRYDLDFKTISKSNFYLICRLVKAQNIISLTLSNSDQTLNQNDLFFSLVRLQQLTRIRSLTLLHIDQAQLNFILKRINLKSLTSFTFTMRNHDDRRKNTTHNLLTSIIRHSNLRRLEFYIRNEKLLQNLWSVNSTIQYLKTNNCITVDDVFTILQHSPYLHTIIMKNGFNQFNYSGLSTFSFQISFPQLKSIIIEQLSVTTDELQSFLSLTPSLIYLKLIGRNQILDGKRWEQFIQINLPHLNKFEFSFSQCYLVKKTSADLELIITPFQSSFWIEHKKWFVTCECDLANSYSIHLYSIPICVSSLQYEPKFEKLSLSTCTMTIEDDLTAMNNIKSLTLTLNKSLSDHIQEKSATVNHPLFPQVTELMIDFVPDWSFFPLQSLSVIINIAQIVQMNLQSYLFHEYQAHTLINIGLFLAQASNLSSLILQSTLSKYRLPQIILNICPIIPRQLKHLQIPVNSLEHIQMILDRCKNLSTIEFHIKPTFAPDIIQWFNDNTINSTYKKSRRAVNVWIGKMKIQANDFRNENKRMKLI